MFYDANSFNGDLSSGEISSITTLYGMFANASSFNQDLSGSDVATFIVTAVNDRLNFTKGLEKTALEDSASNIFLGWSTNINGGSINESSQNVTFTLSKSNNSLVSAQPARSSSDKLTFIPADNASGLATVAVSLSDDGGTANEGD